MITVAITGRSGCGKSSVSNFIRSKGYSVIDGDELSREILQKGSPILPALQKEFGEDILDSDGCLLRRLLADRAFISGEKTAALNSITHPEIMRRMLEGQKQAEEEGSALYFIDGAVIIGTPFQGLCQKIVVVSVETEVSIKRICSRDGISPEMAERRLSAQPSDKWLVEKADYVIKNNSTLEALERQISELLSELEALA